MPLWSRRHSSALTTGLAGWHTQWSIEQLLRTDASIRIPSLTLRGGYNPNVHVGVRYVLVVKVRVTMKASRYTIHNSGYARKLRRASCPPSCDGKLVAMSA